MKDFRIPLLLILLILIPILLPGEESGSSSPDATGIDYGIDPEKSYDGRLVIDLLIIAEEEGARAMKEAWEEGYKAGVIAWKPDAEYWKKKAEEWKKEAQGARMPWWSLPVTGVLSFLFGGLVVHTTGGTR